MNTIKTGRVVAFIFAFTACALGRAQDSAGSSDSKPLDSEISDRIISGVAMRDIQKNAQAIELDQLNASGSEEVKRHVMLAEETLNFLKEKLPKLKNHYEALLRGDSGLLYNDEGKFLAQNRDFVETILRWMMESRISLTGVSDPEAVDEKQVDLGENEFKLRTALLSDALAQLKANSGLTFDPESSPAALVVANQATWVTKAFELIDSRVVLLEASAESVPEDVETANLPSLQTEVTRLFTSRISAFENELNEVDRIADENRTKLLAEATSKIAATKLEDELKNLNDLFDTQRRLDRYQAEKEIQAVSIEAERLKEQIETKYQRELAAKDERAEQLAKELKASELEIERVKTEIAKLESRLKISEAKRQLPADTKVLLAILSAPGHWAPKPSNWRHAHFLPDGRYEGLKPQPHSLSTLAASGALDDSAEGLYKLYLIMATNLDKERPRYKRIIEFNESRTQGVIKKAESAEALLTSSDEMKEATKKLGEIQQLVNQHGEQLVEEGLLAP